MPVNGDDWAAMQAQLAAGDNKRKRRFVWWWLAGILFLAGSSVVTYSLLSNDSPKNTIAESTTVQTPSAEGNATQADDLNTSTNEGAKTENTSSLPSSSGQETGNTSEPTNTTTMGSSSKSNQSKVKGSSDPSQSVTNNGKETQPSTKGTNNKGKQSSKEDKQPNDATPQEDDKENNKDKQDNTEQHNPNTIPNGDKQPVTLDSNSKKQEGTEFQEDNTPTQPTAKEVEKKPKKPTDSTTKTKEYKPFSFSFKLGSGASTYNSSGTTNFGRIVNAANQTALALNGSFMVNYSIPKLENLEVQAGLGFNSYANSGNYNYTHQTYDSVPVLNPQGQVIGYFYTNFRDTSHNFSLQSRYTYITLPVGIAYSFPIGNNSGIRLAGNVSAQYLAGASGEYINPFNLFKLNVNDNKDLFRKWNMGFSASAGYFYKLKNGITLEGGLQYSTQTNGLFDNRIGTAIRPSSIGIQIGLKYNITK